jgi:hypothetical protein
MLSLLLLTTACKDGLVDDTGSFDQELLGILIQPEEVVVPLGQDAQLVATGLFDDRTSQDITRIVDWTTSDAGVVDVSNDLDREGLLTGNRVGGGRVTATWRGVTSVPVTVNVTDAELLGLTVEPREVTVAKGDTVRLQAIAAYSDGNRADSSTQVRWITGDGTVAQMDPDGTLTASGLGETTITAEYNGLESADVPVTVVQSADADLLVSSATAEATEDLIILTVKIKNQGDKGASNFWVDVWLDPSSTPKVGDLGDFYDLVPYVGPDEEVQVSYEMDADKGEHTIAILADTDDAVAESNEDNNAFSGSIDVGNSQQGPNLSVSYFSYYADGDSIYYFVDVHNSGTTTVESFYVDLYMDLNSPPEVYQDGEDYVEVTGLEPGETEYADFEINDYCWLCYSYVFIDSYNHVEEIDEDDNIDGPLFVESENVGR